MVINDKLIVFTSAGSTSFYYLKLFLVGELS